MNRTKITILVALAILLFMVAGCRESHRRVSVTVVAHGHYGHRCGGYCSYYRPVIRPPVVVISHGHAGHHCGSHCSHYRPVIIHRSVRQPIIHGRGKTEVRIYRVPPVGPISYGRGPSMGRGRGRGQSSGRSHR